MMQAPQYIDAEHTSILYQGRTIPADPANRDFATLLAALGGVPIAPYVEPEPTAPDVRAEASRRMQLMAGARNAEHLGFIISNGQSEAIRLLRKGPENWSPEEAARAAQLEAFDAAKEAIRAASNVLEALDPVPADYADDRWWR